MKMFKKILRRMFLIAVVLIMYSFELPSGWFIAGSEAKSYEMGIDKGVGTDGKNAATIKSKKKKINGFGTLMQNCSPEKYIGKRVRMSGMVKTHNISGWAGLWLRIDERGSDKSIGFDNMRNGKKDRSICGTTDWTLYEIVLDVPPNASNLAYGALLSGPGQIWFDSLKFEIVDSDIPTTGKGNEKLMPLKDPENLDFEN